ncbi:MAG TPA: prenyltransferase/squalene oxidase repeat-containing protein [Burkholderiaceae bacterium]|nr:prenyltransferase/squalene oxidase repeat-containing protein [Burkholderiaceae bacterium]
MNGRPFARAHGRSAPARARSPFKPLATFARIAWRDAIGAPAAPAPAHGEHLLAAERWLCRAQDACGDAGGVSYGYALRGGGWRAPYPETSGYIAATFFRLGRVRDPSYTERAQRIVRWLTTVQNRDGSFPNPRYGAGGIVFDTGQALFGLVCGVEQSRDPALLEAARRAAAWLTGIAGADGRWTRSEHLGTPHVYNTRTAWALLRMNQLEPDARREAVARANLDWALAEQRPSGFFEHSAFRPGRAPFTHTIAYTARGLLESGALLHDRRYIDAALRCADATLAHLRGDGFLPSTLTTAGRAASSTCCLTGNCQFAIVWSRLAALAERPDYPAAARCALEYVMATQDLSTPDADVRGAIKGSQPVWGPYAPLSFPNWATKFFVDAMWLAAEGAAR